MRTTTTRATQSPRSSLVRGASTAFRAFATVSAVAATVASLGVSRPREAGAAEPKAQDAKDAKASCVASYEKSQTLKKQGRLKPAREELRVCARAVCPALVRNDCLSWLEQVDGAYPSVVLRAEKDGSEIAAVRVQIDGETLAQRLDGKSLEVEPGEHTFTFTAPGEAPLTLPVVIREGEKNRLIAARFGKSPSSPDSASTAQAPPPKLERPVPAGVFVLGGTGVLGVAGFAILGAVGRGRESSLTNSCSPTCPASDIDSVRTTYRLADVSLAIGAASFVSAAVWYALRPTKEAPPAPQVAFVPTREGGMATLGGSF